MNIVEPMDKSEICVAYEYKFHHGKNASQMAKNINEVFVRQCGKQANCALMV